MKKAIIAVIAIALIAGGVVGAIFLLNSQNPEKQIIGKWNNDNGLGSYTFNEDGSVMVGTDVLVSLSYKGSYTLDKENMTLTIVYEALGVSYNDVFNFTIEKDTLTLTSDTLGRVTTFTRDGAEVKTTAAA